MKSTIILILLLFVIISCKKEDSMIIEELTNDYYTITWALSSQYEELYQLDFFKRVEYYNSDGFITNNKGFRANGDQYNSTYMYNENNQLIEYSSEYSDDPAGNYSEVFKYYYVNNLRSKKEFFAPINNLQNYEIYEYSDSVINIILKYDRNDHLSGKLYNYYSSNRIDSSIYYYQNMPDSITQITRYTYNDTDHTMEKNNWIQNRYSDIKELLFVSQTIYQYNNENQIIQIEERNIRTESISIRKYFFDTQGRNIRTELHSNNEMYGYYSATYSDESKNTYIIPEL